MRSLQGAQRFAVQMLNGIATRFWSVVERCCKVLASDQALLTRIGSTPARME